MDTDCVQKLSNGKRMDIDAEIRTVVEKNPGVQAKNLIEKVSRKTRKSRSTIYKHITSLVNSRQIFSKKGKYWSTEPEHSAKKHTGLGFFDWLERREARKQEEIRQIRKRIKAKYKLLYKRRTFPDDHFDSYEDYVKYLDEEYPT